MRVYGRSAIRFRQRRLARFVEGRRPLCRPQPDGALFDLQLDADRGQLELQRPRLQRRQHRAQPGLRVTRTFKGYGAGIWGTDQSGRHFYNGSVYNNGSLVYLERSTR